MLRCPVEKTPLRLMTREELADLNATIAKGGARRAGGDPASNVLAGGLVSSSGAWAYEVAAGIPILLPELGIRRVSSASSAAAAGFRRGEDASTDERWEALSLSWTNLRPPLTPGQGDLDVLQRLVGEGVAGLQTSFPRALLLGITPQIAAMRWPGSTRLLALDFSAAMIRNVWRAPERTDAMVARANWTTMPVRDAACDVVVGDGNLTSLSYPDEYRAYASEIRRVLKDRGTLVLRLFARPERPEPLEGVFADLRGGRIGSASLLPWRIAMALHGDLAAGVRAAGIWEAWCEHVPDAEGLMRSLGWPLQALSAVEWTRGAEYRMRFPTVGEVEDLMAPGFSLTACHVPDYECGAMYPVAVFETRPRS